MTRRQPRARGAVAHAIALTIALLASLVPLAASSAAGIPAEVRFTVQPGDPTIAGQSFAPQPAVRVEDVASSPVADGTAVVLSIRAGSGTAGAILTCAGGNNRFTTGGIATWSGCTIDRAGDNYRLRATAGSALRDSDRIDIRPTPGVHLVFTSYPATNTPSILAPQPALAIVDAAGNVVISDNRVITLTTNQHGASFTCTGGLSKTAVNGIATFSGCNQATTANGYTLTAGDGPGGLSSVTGGVFNVTAGRGTNLLLCWGTAVTCNTSPPASNPGGTPFSSQPSIRVSDPAGAVIVGDNSTVIALALFPGTPASGGPGTLACSGGLSKKVTKGVATFAGCAIDKVGAGYRLTATSVPPLTRAVSSAFNVSTGPAVKLGFVTQPVNSLAGAIFPVSPQVAIEDAGGNVVTSGIVATIELSLSTGSRATTLSCPNAHRATTTNGTAAFAGCSIATSAAGMRLRGSAISTSPATVLTSATSNAFNVTGGAASIAVQASAPTITWGQAVLITVVFGAKGANRPFRLEGARDPNNPANFSLIANLATDASGRVSLSYRPPTNLYYRAVFLGAPDLSPGISPLTRVIVRQIAIIRPTNAGDIQSVIAGTSVTFTTTVRPSRPELTPATVTYTVYRLLGGRWVLALVRDVTATAAGQAQLAVSFSTRGSFYIRSQAKPTPYNANSVNSPIERYDVL